MKTLLLSLFLSFQIAASQDYNTEVKISIPLRDSPEPLYKVLPEKLEVGEIVELLDFNNDFWLVSNGKIEGWLPTVALYRTAAMRSNLAEFKLKSLIKKYGDENGNKIFNGSTWIGMQRNMLYDAKGVPERINQTTSTQSMYQLIYKNEYYYLENDVVTDIQKF